MKITIEPTNNKDYTTCSIKVAGDDLMIGDVFEKLIIPCLLGFGFAEKSINDYLEINQ